MVVSRFIVNPALFNVGSLRNVAEYNGDLLNSSAQDDPTPWMTPEPGSRIQLEWRVLVKSVQHALTKVAFPIISFFADSDIILSYSRSLLLMSAI